MWYARELFYGPDNRRRVRYRGFSNRNDRDKWIAEREARHEREAVYATSLELRAAIRKQIVAL